ncbi:MAG: pilus assembly protein PilP [Oleibacter sp.]|nr:pilus assembly protein PilP [Thalassolituus sp.]|tara:strand:- start:17 stop:544 length:528 start_codon:yes stop_codon:yes gene_type:complete
MKYVVIIAALFLSGCFGSEGTGDLKAYVKSTLNKPRGRIEPIPVFKPYEFFNYSASGMRSPFELPQLVVEDVQVRVGEHVAPDFDRPKEHLEQFPVGQLSMVGTLERTDGILWALVRDGDGGVVRVKEGNHMGQNYGEITEISEYKINLLEIVPDGLGGWLKRPRTIPLDGLGGE